MAKEFNEAGYERFRQLVNVDLTTPSEWEYLELQEDDGTIVWRGSTSGDWSTADTDQVQQFSTTVTGSDIETFMGGDPLPVTITTAAVKDEDTDAGDELADDTFEDVTIAGGSDSIQLDGEVEVPEV